MYIFCKLSVSILAVAQRNRLSLQGPGKEVALGLGLQGGGGLVTSVVSGARPSGF